jgi:hypothetical protein
LLLIMLLARHRLLVPPHTVQKPLRHPEGSGC